MSEDEIKMDFGNFVLRKKRIILAFALALATSLSIGYYLAQYENVCVSSITSLDLGSNPHYGDHPQGVVHALDHGCYLQTSNFSQHQHSEKLLAERNCRKKLPVAVILGAALSGSSTLKSALSFHPDVTVSEFAGALKDNPRYQDAMPYSLPHQITISECQEYLYIRNLSHQNITIFSPDLKFIVLLRDPVARAMSEYLVLRSKSSSEFYRRSLSQYPDFPMGKLVQDVHTRTKRSRIQGFYEGNYSEIKRVRDVEQTNPQRSKRSKGERGNSLHRVREYEIRYKLEDNFEKTILDPSSEIDEMHFLVQRSIYASQIKHWDSITSRVNFLILDAEVFARTPAITLDKVERFLGLRPFFHEQFFTFDFPKGVFCFNSPVRSCVDPIPMQGVPPTLSDEFVNLFRKFLMPAMIVQNRISGAYFPHLGENPMVFTPFR
ncbi:uncharacterized protein LOC121411912 [Lytechinus variegatus]|uniref:uncharacterized protein LOC121411912 n=1 Tax=Lytechinus variegatus TaxID=7654 RepID=UPI001BB1FE6F|nr:uncharacterized protein LOC121411912 [Lytechinus variegatus]